MSTDAATLPPEIIERIQALEVEKSTAVQEEDYDTAKKIKKQIELLKTPPKDPEEETAEKKAKRVSPVLVPTTARLYRADPAWAGAA